MSSDLSLGEYLRQEREKRGITIEQVASATKIGVKTLHSLEGDQYSELPAKPFIRGFVTSYARFIGLDSKEILTRFGDFLEVKSHDRPNREGGHSGYAFEKPEGEQSRTVLWIVMGSFVVAGGIAAVVVKKPGGQKHHGGGALGTQGDKLRAAYDVPASPIPSPVTSVTSTPSPSHSAAAVAAVPSPSPSPRTSPTPTDEPSPVSSPEADASPSPTPSPKGSPTTPPSPKPSPSATNGELEINPEDPLNSGLKLKPAEIKERVVFKAAESAWVRYQCDNRPVTQFVFKEGKVLVLRARETIKFQVSPPKALTFNYNNSGYKPVVGNQDLVTRQSDATLFFPNELGENIEEPFPGKKPLSSGRVPSPRATPTLSPTP
jgi:cytoskeleton protein RodZ